MLLHHRNHHDAPASEIIDEGDGRLVVHVTRALDNAGAHMVADDVRWAALHAERTLVVDCSQCEFIDSSGLRVLVDAQQLAEARRIAFGVRPTPNLVRVLEITGLSEMIAIEL